MPRRAWLLAGGCAGVVVAVAPLTIEWLDRRGRSWAIPGLPVTVSEILMLVGLIAIGALGALALDWLIRRR